MRYNYHYKLRKLGYTIRLKDRHIIRPAETPEKGLKLERKLTLNDNYSVSNSLI